MTAVLESLSSGDRFVFLLVSMIMITSTLVPITVTGFWQWRKVREREAATGLVHDMLARGFTSDEIERVLAGANIDASSADAAISKTKAAFACRS